MPTRRKCPPEETDRLLAIVAENLQRLMDERYPNEPNKRLRLSTDSGVGRTNLNQYLLGRQHPRLDTLMQLAWALDEPVWQLLVPREKLTRVFDTSNVAKVAAMEAPPEDLKRRRSR